MNTALAPYLMFKGETREAMEFYHRVLGGNLQVQTFGDTEGMPAPPGYEDKVMHSQLEADGMMIMASDPPPGNDVQVGDNVQLCFVGTDLGRMTKIFDGLAEGGTVGMKLEKQFWGDTFGSLTDRFGVHWMVNVSDG